MTWPQSTDQPSTHVPRPVRSDGIAIVIPAYNAEATLAHTIESALREPEAHEIVIVDDGSTDGTLAIARRYEARAKILSGPNQGVSAARNRGIASTSSDWLLFLDADDLLLPGTLAKRLAVAEASSADAVVCDWEDMIDDGTGSTVAGPKHSLDWAAMARNAEIAFAVDQWATTAAILYSRRIVEVIGGFRADLPVIQDARLLFDAACAGARFAHAPHIGARYREVPGSLSRRNPARFWLDVLLNGQHIEALWRGRGALNEEQLRAVAGIYDTAARGLFAAGHPDYFVAVAARKRLGAPTTRHSRLATPLARVMGLRMARGILGIVQRGRALA